MADYAAQQEEEIEALLVCLQDDIKELTSNECGLHTTSRCFQITISTKNENEKKPTKFQVRLALIFAHTPNYPDEPPLLEVRSSYGMKVSDVTELKEKLHQKASDSLGMAMVYILQKFAKDWLGDKFDQNLGDFGDDGDDDVKPKDEVIKPQVKAVTIDSFLDRSACIEAESLNKSRLSLEAPFLASKENKASGRARFRRERAATPIGMKPVIEIEGNKNEEDLDFDDDFDDEGSERLGRHNLKLSVTDPAEFDFTEVFEPTSPLPRVAEDEGVDDWSSSPNKCGRRVEIPAIKRPSHSLVGPWEEDDKFDNDFTLNGGVEDNGMVELESGECTASEKLGPHDFELLACVGQGGFAKVFLCRRNGTDNSYAMKVMAKSKIMEKNHGVYMKAERDILTKVVHPFIVQLQYSFQTKTKLYLILDFINGGHLFFQLYRQGTFSEELARIYTAEIICAVGHLHSMGIMHRDLKPENILLDSEGHVKITDFGLAKEVNESTKSNSFCGTVEYMAPEIILGKGHGKAADWWSVGILLFEMLTGRAPFFHNNRHKLQQRIINEKIKMPTYLTSEAVTLLKGLLQKDPSKRLGSGPKGTDEIREHKWFKSIVWRKVLARELQPKFRPSVNGIRCTANFDEMWTKMPLRDSPASTPKGGDDQFFQGYTYIAPNPFLSNQD